MNALTDTDELLDTEVPYLGYAYSYPHKLAYRALSPAVPLRNAWRHQGQSALFLYLHVPFCEYRCGFCNLFTLANSEAGWTNQYLDQLQREANQVLQCLEQPSFARVAIGGGTPTFLSEPQLAKLLDTASKMLAGDAATVPASCEASPATLTAAKADLLRAWGVDRLSLGVQSFDDKEVGMLGRPQRAADVDQAIAVVRDARFPILNLDLIYGGAGQSEKAWLENVKRAVSYQPEEIYLYPLYVREFTGLARVAALASDDRLARYRSARDLLLEQGYQQVSMRMFQRAASHSQTGPAYCCQTDGMVGLGCGARSYTSELHYSTEFAVGKNGVRSILGDYLTRDASSFSEARHGYILGLEERQRRYVIQSLLQAAGLDLADYATTFGEQLWTQLGQLEQLLDRQWATVVEGQLRLTPAGMERSDVIGPWLYSDAVRRLMEESECH